MMELIVCLDNVNIVCIVRPVNLIIKREREQASENVCRELQKIANTMANPKDIDQSYIQIERANH